MSGKRKDGITSVAKLKRRCSVSEDGCWLWNGAQHEGRAAVWVVIAGRGQVMSAARAALVLSGKAFKPRERAWSSCENVMCCNPAHAESGTMSDFGAWQRKTGALVGNVKNIAAARVKGRARSKINLGIAREIRASPLTLEQEARRILEVHGIEVSAQLVSCVRLGKRWAEPNPFAGLFTGLMAANDSNRRAA